MPQLPRSAAPVAAAAAVFPLAPALVDPEFENRWTAWQRRGAAHDATIRRRLRIAAPLLAAAMAAAAYLLNQ